MEWLGATIDINGFSMVLRLGNHWSWWFSMVAHHWSNDGMVTYHHWNVGQTISLTESWILGLGCTNKENLGYLSEMHKRQIKQIENVQEVDMCRPCLTLVWALRLHLLYYAFAETTQMNNVTMPKMDDNLYEGQILFCIVTYFHLIYEQTWSKICIFVNSVNYPF